MNSSKEKKVLVAEIVGIVSISICVLVLVLNIQTVEKYTVSFNSVGGTHITSERVLANKKVGKPTNPVKEGYIFMGWYNDNVEFDFNESVTTNMDLEAKWEKIEESQHQNQVEDMVENIKDIQIGQAIVWGFN